LDDKPPRLPAGKSRTQPPGVKCYRAIPAADRPLDRRPDPPSTIRQPRRHTFSGMDETQTLALQALRELLDNPDRDDWDKLVAASRAARPECRHWHVIRPQVRTQDRPMVALPARHVERPRAVGAHVAQCHGLDRFVEAPGCHRVIVGRSVAFGEGYGLPRRPQCCQGFRAHIGDGQWKAKPNGKIRWIIMCLLR
jgi:hypothetical protein